jgi:hypothetical protein
MGPRENAFLDLLSRVYGIHPGGFQTVEAVAANETIAKQLRAEDGFPC